MTNRHLTQDEIPFYTRVFSFISLAALIGTWIVALTAYGSLPETIPSHFNLNGEIDGYSNKVTIFLLPGIATITVLFLLLITNSNNPFIQKLRKPGKYQVQLSPVAQIRVLSSTTLLTALLFLLIEITLVEAAKTGEIPSYFLLIFVISGLLIVVPLVEAFRSR